MDTEEFYRSRGVPLTEKQRSGLAQLRTTSAFRKAYYQAQGTKESSELRDLIMLEYTTNLFKLNIPESFRTELFKVTEELNSCLVAGIDAFRAADERREKLRTLLKDDYFIVPSDAYQTRWIYLERMAFDKELAREMVEKKPVEGEPFSDEELNLLLRTLRESGELLAKLTRPLPQLSHRENIDIALQHARLFLLGSELPICLGVRCTYADLKKKARGEPVSPNASVWLDITRQRLAEKRSPMPSKVEYDRRLKTLLCHDYKGDEFQVRHETAVGCPGDVPVFFKRLLRLGSPYLFKPGSEVVPDWERCADRLPDDEVELEKEARKQYQQWELSESPEVYNLLMQP